MGGWQTLRIGPTHLDRSSQLGVFSSGFPRPNEPETFARANARALDDPNADRRLRLLGWAIGRDDFRYPRSQASRAMLDAHGVR